MLFGSKAKKSLIGSGENMLHGYRADVRASGVKNPDRDAVLIFSGFTHFALTAYITNGQLKRHDVQEILTACAMNVRKVVPNHDLGVNYLEETQALVRQALDSDRDPLQWTKAYYDGLADRIQTDEGTFLGLLTRDSLKVLQTIR